MIKVSPLILPLSSSLGQFHQQLTLVLLVRKFCTKLFDSSNAVQGETFTHTPLKKGNQTFVLRETNFVLHKKQNKTKSEKPKKGGKKSSKNFQKLSKKAAKKDCQKKLLKKVIKKAVKEAVNKPSKKNCQ